jgi:hypothetical protein
MNDHELEEKLKAARVPERSAEYWESFPGKITAQIRRLPERRKFLFRIPRLAWSLAAGCACLLLGMAIWQSRSTKVEPYAFLQDGKVVHETLAMFPNQVRAIVQDKHGTKLILSDKADVPSSTPLWIKICSGQDCRVVITFSGQHLQIARETVEVLADAQGQVMRVGDRLFWSATEQTSSARSLRIQARPLALM